MWGRTSSGRENGHRFTAGHHYEVGGALGPVPGAPQGERCASPNPVYPQGRQGGKGVKEEFIDHTPARWSTRSCQLVKYILLTVTDSRYLQRR
jgi:hypothetical protein